MTRLNRYLATALLGTIAGAAGAAPFTDEQRAAVADEVSAFNEAFAAGNLSEVMMSIPPKVMDGMAEQAGVPVDEFRAMMVQQVEAMMVDVTVDSFEMDLDAATWVEAPSGEPYALIPTVTEMTMSDQSMRGETQTLAFEADGEIWLTRIENAEQLALLTEAYPELEGIEVPEGSVVPVD